MSTPATSDTTLLAAKSSAIRDERDMASSVVWENDDMILCPFADIVQYRLCLASMSLVLGAPALPPELAWILH